MAREIDILCAAAGRGWAVVEKTSNVLWTPEELADAARSGCYPDPDYVGLPEPDTGVSGPFPGCAQQWGKSAAFGSYYLLGETEHFALFVPPEGARFPGE